MLFDLYSYDGTLLEGGTLDDLRKNWLGRDINKINDFAMTDHLPWVIRNVDNKSFYVYENNTGLFAGNQLNKWNAQPFKFESIIFDIVLNNNVTILLLPHTTYYCWNRNTSSMYNVESTKYKKQNGVICFYSEGDRLNYINLVSDKEEVIRRLDEEINEIRVVE